MREEDFPVIGQYRGCPIFDYQDQSRIDGVVEPAIDIIIAMNDPVELYEYARNSRNPPESRLLAEAKVAALAENRHISRNDVDMTMLRASTAGLGSWWMDYRYYCSMLEFPVVHGPGADLSGFDERPGHQQKRMREDYEARAERGRKAWWETYGRGRLVAVEG